MGEIQIVSRCSSEKSRAALGTRPPTRSLDYRHVEHGAVIFTLFDKFSAFTGFW